MYKIDRKKEKPDIGYMQFRLEKLMERGIRVNDCSKLKQHYTDLRAALRLDFKEKYGIDNPNSTKQLTEFIKDLSSRVSLDSKNDIINICYNDESDKWTTSAEAMEKLADLGYEFASDLLDYRHAKKYAEALESVSEAIDDCGLIHPTVSLGKTNRVNYSKPGIMTIPKELLWDIVKPYKDGNYLYSIDIKNQEPNLLINISGADELKYALESEEGLYETMYKNCFKPRVLANVLVDTLPEDRVYKIPELKALGTVSPAMYSASKPLTRDLYCNGKRVVAIETVCVGSSKGVYPSLPDNIFVELEDGDICNVPVKWESADKKFKKASDYTLLGELEGIEVVVSKVGRREFKQSWLALSYGASSFGIKSMCKTIDGGQVYKYITGIKAIKDYRNQIDKISRQGISTICTIFGTRLFAGDFGGDYKRLKRILLDLPIQGSGADILSLLIERFYSYTSEKGLSDKLELYYTRHDELIVEVNKDWACEVGDKYVKDILADMLEHQIDDWTPFKLEIKRVDNK